MFWASLSFHSGKLTSFSTVGVINFTHNSESFSLHTSLQQQSCKASVEQRNRPRVGFEFKVPTLQDTHTKHSVKGTSPWPSNPGAGWLEAKWQDRQPPHESAQAATIGTNGATLTGSCQQCQNVARPRGPRQASNPKLTGYKSCTPTMWLNEYPLLKNSYSAIFNL